MDEEPSVLDYVKDRLAFWRPARIHLPESETEPIVIDEPGYMPAPLLEAAAEGEEPRQFPIGLAAILVALLSQFFLEAVNRADPFKARIGIGLYGITAVLLALAYFRKQWLIAPLKEDETGDNEGLLIPGDPLMIILQLIISFLLAAIGFIYFGKPVNPEYLFTPFNLVIWAFSLLFFLRVFWIPGLGLKVRWNQVRAFLKQRSWSLVINRWTLLLVLVAGLAFFFHLYQLNHVPPEMVSDHAEKLLDVSDVLAGKTAIYFPRNTGREFFQFYLTVAVIALFKTGVTFLSLKIGTAIAALATLPFIYLLGKEVGNRWVALFATLFAGISYWANMFTRIALRFTLYPLFAAPTLYFLIRGLRRRSRNDMILAGIFLGFGLHGYTSFRIMPFLVVAAIILYIVHAQSRGNRKQALFALLVLGAAAFIVFLPLFRYAVDNPDMFAFRAFSRLGTVEQPLPGPALPIFLSNFWKASIMFFWDNGEIWVHSVVHRPALDLISAAVFFCGVVVILIRYIQRRHWLDLFLLVSVPVLMLPSILSLAFPGENPSLNRTSGAIIPVFLILGIGLDGLFAGFKNAMSSRAATRLAVILGLAFVIFSCLQNYDLVFNQYEQVYLQSSWNTTEMGAVVRGFADSIGDKDSAWVVGYPYWVDTRLVGINAGYPTKDYAIFPNQIPDTLADPHPKLFILNMQDTQGMLALRTTYPQGLLATYHSQVPGKDFYTYLVLPSSGSSQ